MSVEDDGDQEVDAKIQRGGADFQLTGATGSDAGFQGDSKRARSYDMSPCGDEKRHHTS